MARVLVATSNPGKLREYRLLLADLPIEIVSLQDAGITREVEETGETFAENAISKAKGYSEESGMVTLADDSGLEVDALGGQPGVRSSRFAGPDADDRQRVELLLEKLQDVPWSKRAARFRAVVAVATPSGHVEAFVGTCEGTIALEPRGAYGFGYDPVFYLPLHNLTMAELAPEMKNQISHRAEAIKAARPALARLAEGASEYGKQP